MSNTGTDHFYFVDPGIGEKQSGCPYTFYKDGHDIRTFITPPDGYELTDFKLEPYPEDKFYDGKIVAQFKKITFAEKLKRNLKRYVLIFLTIIGLLAAAVFGFNFVKQHKNGIRRRLKLKPKTEIKAKPVDKTKQKQGSDTTSFNKKIVKLNNGDIKQKKTGNEEIQKAATPDNNEHNESLMASQPEIDPNSNQGSPQAILTTEQFQQEFWDMIHRKARQMSTYGDLYRKYKDSNINGNEFSYLYATILENNNAFDVWKAKMLQIPEDEINSINSISALKQKLEEYEDEEEDENEE